MPQNPPLAFPEPMPPPGPFLDPLTAIPPAPFASPGPASRTRQPTATAFPAPVRSSALPSVTEIEEEAPHGNAPPGTIPFPLPPRRRGPSAQERPAKEVEDWGLPLLLGRLTEISGAGSTGILSCAFGLVAEAQRDEDRYGLAAWVGTTGNLFFPPDAIRAGASPERLVLLRLASASEQVRAAASLARSGIFGLIVLDLVESASTAPFFPSFRSSVRPHRARRDSPSSGAPPLTRLAGLARRHRSAVVALTEKPPSAPSLDPWVLGRYDAVHGEDGIAITVVKDKRAGEAPFPRSPFPPGFRFSEECDAPAGMSGLR